MTTEIRTRPIWNDEMREELAHYAGKLVNQWCNNETDLEDCVDASRKVLRHHYDEDGYELAKQFERSGFSADSELVEQLDSISYQQYVILENHIKKWVTDANITLLLPLETKVKVSIENKKCVGEIVKLYPEKAMYGVWVGGKSGPKGTSHYLIESEKVNPELLQP